MGGIFDAALVEYGPKSPQIACFRACGAPRDAIRVGVARRGTYFFLPKVVVFGGRRGTIISASTCRVCALVGPNTRHSRAVHRTYIRTVP